MAELSTKPWDGSPGRYTDQQYRRACLVDSGDGATPKARYKLPVREPDGTLNRNAITSAYSVLRGGMGGVNLNPQKKTEALSKLRTIAASVGMKLGGAGTGQPGANAKANGSGRSGGPVPPQFLSKQKEGKTSDMSRFDVEPAEGYVGVPYAGDYQLPYDFSTATKEGPNLWRKQILPKGSVLHDGEVVTFTDDILNKIRDNHHARAFDHTPVTLVSQENEHGNNPESVRGEIQDYAITEDGLDAIIRLDDRGEEMISSNPGAHGISARFKSDYTRKDDGQYFGPVIAHGAITSEPYISGLRPWENFRDFSDARDADSYMDLSGDYWYENPDPDEETLDFGETEYAEEGEQEGDGSGDVEEEEVEEEEDDTEYDDLSPEDQELIDGLVADLSATYGSPDPESRQTATRKEEGMGASRNGQRQERAHDFAYQELERSNREKDERLTRLEQEQRDNKVMSRLKDFSANGGPRWARDYLEPMLRHAHESEDSVEWKDFSSGRDKTADIMDLVEGLMEGMERSVDFSDKGDPSLDDSSAGESKIKEAEKLMESESISFTAAARKVGITT